MQSLMAISPIDGRYYKITAPLSQYFSEYALIKYRVGVEWQYFAALEEQGFFTLTRKQKKAIQNLSENFSREDAADIKATEKITNHDVKAVEYFIKARLNDIGAEKLQEWVHFGLTSQDINNTAFPMMWRDALIMEYLPATELLTAQLNHLAVEWKNIPMLARTHGQPASPTRLGKEMKVFAERLSVQLKLLARLPHTGKFGGATGNFNAHHAAFPKFKWKKFADEFLQQRLGLQRQQTTTQIEHYDGLAAQFDAISRINTILTDLCRDFWTYISMDYFKQSIKKNEVGSSAMPHKVNPIDFENAEGNLGMANAIFHHLSAKLPVSRLQRDLTDSTVLRNIGTPLAHTLIAMQSIQKGLGKLILNKGKLEQDLEENWAVVAEAVQTILRRENFPNPYEALKALTRNNERITRETVHQFINSLDIKPAIRKELLRITPHNYTGV